jgi:hypothetical protein
VLRSFAEQSFDRGAKRHRFNQGEALSIPSGSGEANEQGRGFVQAQVGRDLPVGGDFCL